MTTARTIAVTGASGFVGRHLVDQLLARGHRVHALIRNPSKASEAFGSPLAQGLELSGGDIGDPAAVERLVQSTDACIHLVGIIRETRGDGSERPQTFERMHALATKVVTDACAAAGVRRYLHMSALGVGPEGRTAYQKSKWEGEQIVRRSGLDWTIFRPSLIHGPDGEFIRMLADIASGEIAPWYFIPYFVRLERDMRVPAGPMAHIPANIQPVAVEDVARAFAEALDRPETAGEIYNLVGSEVLDWRSLSEFIRDALPGTDKDLSVWHVPGEHAAVIATIAAKLGLGSLLPFDAGQAIMATEDSVADLHKVRADLGFEPKPFRATVKAYAGAV